LKIRHILLALLVLLAIAFMQPLITFLGGLTLLVTVGILIFRDLSPAAQDAVERRMLGWLRQARAGSWPESNAPAIVKERFPTTSAGVPGIPERTRRSRAKATAPDAPDFANDNPEPPPS
jgi:hypothetical protein